MTSQTAVYDELALLRQAQADPSLQVTIVDHPLVRQSLSYMRDGHTSMAAFRAAVNALSPILLYAAAATLAEKTVKIATPLAPVTVCQLSDRVVLIPVLRSGLGMLDSAEKIFPDAVTIFAGMARDETTAIAHWYYALKDLEYLNGGQDTVFLVLDPMLATGGSALETIRQVRKIYPQGKVKMISMIAAPEGIRKLNAEFPDVPITVAAVDDHLNEKAYIVPGLGDAGDRQFGTVT